jgi:hypothetical protein
MEAIALGLVGSLWPPGPRGNLIVVFWVSDNPTPVLFKAIFGFFSMVVMVMWAMWWYAQRKHFVQGDSR